MKKSFFILSMALAVAANASAQSFAETFDANTLGWTESKGDTNTGTAVINKGVMTVKAKGDGKFMRFAVDPNAAVKTEHPAFETHCYAPLNVKLPFEMVANVKTDDLNNDRLAGVVFNYKDSGTFYAFVFNKEAVAFLRFVDYRLVGSILQDINWGKANKGKREQTWKLVSDGDALQFWVNDIELMKVKHMPLDFTGMGFYTIGKQTLTIDDVTFTQN